MISPLDLFRRAFRVSGQISLDFLSRMVYTCVMVTKRKPWTTEERHILKKYYGVETLEQVILRLPDRTAQAVYKQVQYLRKRGWTFNRNINE